MGARRLVVMFCSAALFGCAPDALRGRRTTLVSRERRVEVDGAARAYFSAVYGHQRALRATDARRADHLSTLASMLGLLPNAPRNEVADAIRRRLDELGVARVRVRFGAPEMINNRLDDWYASVLSPPARDDARDSVDGRYRAVEETVGVSLSPEPESASLGSLLAEISAVLRDAEATRRCMERLTQEPAPVLTSAESLRAELPGEMRGELAEAERFVMSIPARATVQAQESARLERWIVDALSQESDGTPEGEDAARP